MLVCRMCSDNQDDCNVYHYLRITSGKEVQQISDILRTTRLFVFFCSSEVFFMVVDTIT